MWPRSASSAMALFAALFEQCRQADGSSRESATVELPKARRASTPKTRTALSERSGSSNTEAGHIPCGSRYLAVWGFKFDPPGGSKMTPVLLSTQEGTVLHRPEPPPVGGQHTARRDGVARGLGTQLFAVPFAQNERAGPAKLCDLLPRRRKLLPTLPAYRPFSVFVNQEHRLLWPSIPRLRRMVFRAAHAPVAAAPQVLARSPHACLRLGRARLIPFLSLSCLITPHIAS